MEGAAVTAAHGAMGSVLAKLDDFLTDNSTLTPEEKKQIVFLNTRLESMYFTLGKISDAENPNPQHKNWALEARELSYDIEDIVDESRFRLESVESKSNNKPRGFKGFVKRGINVLTPMTNQHRITEKFEEVKFEEVKRRVMELQIRQRRYHISDTLSTPDLIMDLRLAALYSCPGDHLVGIDRPRDELIQLMDEESVPAHQLKVISIVGFGGIGKTTLVNQIYRKIKGQYHSQAFVPVSRRPNIRKILRMTLALVGFVDANLVTWDEKQLIDALREFLRDKRYFIVIDDIWDIRTWERIRCALPENRNSSRVITTTRNENVAIACCGSLLNVHRMKPLSDQDSRKLLLERVFNSEDACPPHLKEIATKIVKKCGGLPLAIISASRLLDRNLDKWDNIFESWGSNMEDTRQILNFSYIDLPHHLKTCMLYMGIYPRDYTISKYDLTKQWIAEGFVSYHHGIDLGDAANNYLNDLINRSMIQPTKTDYSGEVVSCRVHDMMLDLIRHNAREENFMTALDAIKDIAVQQNKIRRLALHLDGLDDDRVVDAGLCSQIRTLARFGTSSYLLPLSGFKHLRTLIVEIPGKFQSEVVLDFTGICGLFQLKYLKIEAKTHDVVLPSEFGNLLQLETFYMEFRCNYRNGNSLISDRVAERVKEILRFCVKKCYNLRYVHVNAIP